MNKEILIDIVVPLITAQKAKKYGIKTFIKRKQKGKQKLWMKMQKSYRQTHTDN